MRGILKTFYHKGDKWHLTIETDEDMADRWNELLNKDLNIELKVYRDKRSLEQNNYYWALLKAIGDKHRITKEKVHEQMMLTYGSFCYMAIPVNELPKIKKFFKFAIDRGDITLTTESGNKVECKQVQCYKSSKEYNSEEFSVLLDGAITTAKDEGIDIDNLKELKVYSTIKRTQ